jgi:hypothetical protein
MQCPGCQAKVVVKHEELLGKSLPCPKCKHQIVVPQQGPTSNPHGIAQREPQPTFDSAALTKEDYGDWDEVLANLPQNPTGIDPEQIDWSPIESNDSSAESFFPIQPIETAPPKPSTASDWQSRNVKKRRQVLLVGTIAILSSLLAGVGFFGFLAFMRNNDSAQSRKPASPSADATSSLVDQPPKGIQVGSEPGTSNEFETNGKQSGDERSDEPPENKTGTSEPIMIPSANSGSPAGSSSTKPGPDSPASSDSATGSDSDVSETATKPAADSADSVSDPTFNLPPQLKRFQDLLNNSRGTFGSNPDPRPSKVVDELDVENLQYPFLDVFHPEAKPLPSWNQAASIVLSRISAPNETPFTVGLEEIGRLTGVGVTIDWQSIRAAGLNDKPLVTWKFEGKSIDAMLDEVLLAHQLALKLDAKGYPIIQPRALPTKPSETVAWDLREFCPEGFAGETAELLISMWELKDVCSQVDGVIVWNDKASLLDKARLYESVRHLSQLTGKPLPDWSATELFQRKQFSVDAWRDSRGMLTAKLPETAIIKESRPAVSLVQTAAAMVGGQVMVDWQTAWEYGLTPHEEMIAVLRNRTFSQVVRKVLVEYALELVPIDSETFWMTTGATRQRSLCVVPIKPPAELKLDFVKRTLSKLRPLGEDGLSRFQFRAVPGLDGIYFARICPPNSTILMQDEFASILSW